MIWVVVSFASATIPTAALMANMIVINSIRRAVRKSSEQFSNRFEEWAKEAQSPLALRQNMVFVPQQHSRSLQKKTFLW